MSAIKKFSQKKRRQKIGAKMLAPKSTRPSWIYLSNPTNLLIPNSSTYKWGRRAGVIKYSGKYVKIYFNMKITFITIRSLNT